MNRFSRIVSILILSASSVAGGFGACNGLFGVQCDGDDPGCDANLYLLQFLAATRTNNFATHMYVVDSTTNVKAYTLDRDTGLATAGAQLSLSNNPEDLVVDATGQYLYVGNRFGSPGVYGYSLAVDGAQPIALSGNPFIAGAGPIHMSLDRANNRIYAAMQSQQAEAYAIDSATGAVSALSGSPFGAGCISEIEYNSATMPSYASYMFGTEFQSFAIDGATGSAAALTSSPSAFIPDTLDYSQDGNFLFVTSRTSGMENILVARINADGTFSATGSPIAFGPTNEVARDVEVSASGQLAYATSSTTDTIFGFSVDTSTGALTALADSPTSVGSSGVTVVKMSPDDKFLYVGHNTGVTIYSVASSGALTQVGTISGLTNVENMGFRQLSETLF